MLLLGYLEAEKSENARKREAAKHIVVPSNLVFQDMRLGVEFGNDYRLTGRVKNNSPHTITAVTVRILISDCDANGHRDVVGDKEEECNLRIPPGQARDLNETLYMDHGTGIRKTMQWSYSVPDVSAEP